MTSCQEFIAALERLEAGEITVEQLLEQAGGSQVWLPTLRSYHQTRRWMAICQYPSRDYKVVARHFGVSIVTVYRAWKSGAA